ncbi:MAG: PilX N-terminal domain-containing pilus assembly protein [Candidatus Sedimenticola sp. PURPLELP]
MEGLRNCLGSGSSQGGVVLMSGLIILTVLTLLGISRIQATQLEARMAGNYSQRTTAFEAAEAAVRAAEIYLDSKANLSGFDADGSDGLYACSSDDRWKGIDWDAKAVKLTGFHSAYIVEHCGTFSQDRDARMLNRDSYDNESGSGGTRERFLITARGTGPSGSGQVFIQATYELEM